MLTRKVWGIVMRLNHVPLPFFSLAYEKSFQSLSCILCFGNLHKHPAQYVTSYIVWFAYCVMRVVLPMVCTEYNQRFVILRPLRIAKL